MVDCLLDSSVLVDLLRGYEMAQTWIASQNNPGVSRVVWLEVIEGALDKNDQRQALRLLNQFELVEMMVEDFEWATRRLIRFNLSHNVEAMDCLIAAPSQRLQLPLYTPNMKHFVPLLGALARQPY